jgi:hypothetical protein
MKATQHHGGGPHEEFSRRTHKEENPHGAEKTLGSPERSPIASGAGCSAARIVHEPDDLRPDNPASNPPLMDLLARELVAAQFDLKHLHRLILNSQAYQRSAIPSPGITNAVEHFACYPLRRLDAEVLIDAINQITGTHDRYSSVIRWSPSRKGLRGDLLG